MAESHIVSGLVAKHAELAGLIQFHQAEINRVSVDIKHLDATLKLFAPELDLRSLGNKRVRKSSMGGFKHFKNKESHTLVLDQLRVAAEPLTTVMMCTAIMADRGMEDTKDLRISIQRTLIGTLRRLEKRGLVKDVGRAENGLSALWQIA
jgi:monoamine oxidase